MTDASGQDRTDAPRSGTDEPSEGGFGEIPLVDPLPKWTPAPIAGETAPPARRLEERPQVEEQPQLDEGPPPSRRRSIALAIGAVVVAAVVVVVVRSLGGAPPQTATDAVSRGLAAQGSGDFDAAARHYRTAIRLDPRDKFAYFNLGVVEQDRGRTEAAERHYLAALNIDPRFESALFNLAIVYTAREPSKAARVYERVLRLNPRSAQAHANYGSILLALGRRAEGNRHLDRAIELDPRLAERISAIR